MQASLAASRTHLARHLQETPMVGSNLPSSAAGAAGPTAPLGAQQQVTSDGEREELRFALAATQVGVGGGRKGGHFPTSY